MSRRSASRHGFDHHRVIAASRRRNILAARVAIGSLAIGLVVALTVVSVRIATAMPA